MGDAPVDLTDLLALMAAIFCGQHTRGTPAFWISEPESVGLN